MRIVFGACCAPLSLPSDVLSQSSCDCAIEQPQPTCNCPVAKPPADLKKPPMTQPACLYSDLTIEPKQNDAHPKARSELSGLVLLDGGDRLIALSNEAVDDDGREFVLQVFEVDPDKPERSYKFKQDLHLYTAPQDDCTEADFEALTRRDDLAGGDYDLFAIASHSSDRKKQKSEDSYDKNRKRLTREGIKPCPARYQL